MMLGCTHAVRRLLGVLVAGLLIACATAGSAQAAPYGQLTAFGEGQLELPEYAIGVNPEEENSVFVVDQAVAGSTGVEFRVQKFEKVAGKYALVASANFEPKDSENPKAEGAYEIQGVAVDPKLGRLYVLAVEQRRTARIDSETLAAGSVYAFKTKQVGGKLEGAAKSGGEEGLLTGPKELKTIGKNAGEALLETNGIAVDPSTGDVILAGKVDLGSGHEPEYAVALQRISSVGKLGARYVDETNYYEESGITSPIVSNGHVYVVHPSAEESIDEIPMSFNGKEAPHPVFQFNCETCVMEGLTKLLGPGYANGAQMAVGGEGNVYIRARVKLAPEGIAYGGALVFNPEFKELGWTGGQAPAKAIAGKCVINELESNPAIAAGKGERLFVLTARTSVGSEKPQILEFGPGGEGCPPASATPPTLTVGGAEVEQVPIADTATLASTLTQANALSTEWNFGDGSAPVVTGRTQQATRVTHKFTKGGVLSVKETIHTDNLASPVIALEKTVEVVAGPGVKTEPPTAIGSAVTFHGSVNPFESKVSECEFEYGATTSYGSKTKCEPLPGGGAEPEAVSAKASLTPGTYHARLRAKNGSGETLGKDETFVVEAEGQGPAVVTGAAVEVGQSSAKLTATVNPKGSALTKCEFEYGTTNSYGKAVSCATLPPASATKPEAVSAAISGLSAASTYHFRIVATGAGGTTSRGGDAQLSTSSASCTSNCGGGGGGGGSSNNSPSSTTGGGSGGGVLGYKAPPPPPPVPVAGLASTSTTVNTSGAFALKVSCPAGETLCAGTATLRTLSAVVAAVGSQAKKRASILTLATGSFTVLGGQTKALTLHLSGKARALLGRMHVLRARVTLVAHDAAGATHTTVVLVTLKAGKPAHKHH